MKGENIMKQASSIKDFQVPMALPGVLASSSPTDFALFQTMQLVKFDGKLPVYIDTLVAGVL
jgi:hypothetical protein